MKRIKNTKKLLALVISLALVLVSLNSAMIFSNLAESTNLIKNGDFEDSTLTGGSIKGDTSGDASVTGGVYDFDNWYRSGYKGASTPYSTVVKHGGNGSFRMNVGSGYGWSYDAFFRNFEVEKNTEYTVSFWYYITSLGNSVQASISTVNAVNPETASARVLGMSAVEGTSVTLANTGTAKNTWHQYTGTFNSADNDKLRIIFRLTKADNIEKNIYIDDLEIKKVENPTPVNKVLIENGDFEDSTLTGESIKGGTSGDASVTGGVYDFDNWYRSGYKGASTPYSTVVKHGGNGSFRMNVGSGYGWSYDAFFRNFEVEKNTEYTVSFWYYINSLGNSVQASISTVNAVNPETASARVLGMSAVEGTSVTLANTGTAKDTWLQYTGTFNSADNDKLRIIFRLTAAENIEKNIYIDDLVINKVESEDNKEDLIFTNGDFENSNLTGIKGGIDANNPSVSDGKVIDYDNWYRFGYSGNYTNQHSTEKPYNGSASLKLFSAAGYEWNNNTFYKNFKVKKNTKYLITFYYNVESLVNKVQAGISTVGVLDPTNSSASRLGMTTVNGEKYTLANQSTEKGAWLKYSNTFDSGDYEDLRLIFRFSSGSNKTNSCMYVDDIYIREVGGDGPIVANGDFENDMTGWGDSDKISEISTTEKYEGKKSLKLNEGRYSKVLQTVIVEENKNYEFSFWYKGKFGLVPNWGISGGSSININTNSIDYGALSNTDDWKQYKCVFSSGDGTVFNLIFQSHVGCEFYIDNVSVVETTESAPIKPESNAPVLIGKLPGSHSQVRYTAKQGTSIITNSDFENVTPGNWESLLSGGNMSVVQDTSALDIMGGDKVLKYSNSTGKEAWDYCYVEVEPNTEYYLSVWAKGAPWNKDTNRNDLTFGIANAYTGEFIVPASASSTSTTEKQFVLPSTDNEWHLITKNFNTGSATVIAFAVKAACSEAYFDNLEIYKAADAEIYKSAHERIEYSKIVEFNPVLTSCPDDKNLIKNGDFSDKNDSYWSSEKNFGITAGKSIYGNFLEIKDTGSVRGTALHYIANDKITGYPLGTIYKKTIELKPNTEYTFSLDYSIIKPGVKTFVTLLDDNTYYPTKMALVEISEDYYDSDLKWKSYACTFKTPDRDNVMYLTIADGGGEFYLDNVKLFETRYAEASTEPVVPEKLVTDDYVVSNEYITNISEGTTVQQIVNNLDYKSFVKVYKDGKEITDYNVLAGTGLEICYVDGFSTVARSTVIIAGDSDGDGKSNKNDIQVFLKYLTNKIELNSLQIEALDIDRNGVLDINDCALISKHSTGVKKLENMIIK